MFRGANEVNAGENSKEPSVQEVGRYYKKFKDASVESIEKFVASTEGQSNAAIIRLADTFEVEKKTEHKPKSKSKEK